MYICKIIIRIIIVIIVIIIMIKNNNNDNIYMCVYIYISFWFGMMIQSAPLSFEPPMALQMTWPIATHASRILTLDDWLIAGYNQPLRQSWFQLRQKMLPAASPKQLEAMESWDPVNENPRRQKGCRCFLIYTQEWIFSESHFLLICFAV